MFSFIKNWFAPTNTITPNFTCYRDADMASKLNTKAGRISNHIRKVYLRNVQSVSKRDVLYAKELRQIVAELNQDIFPDIEEMKMVIEALEFMIPTDYTGYVNYDER